MSLDEEWLRELAGLSPEQRRLRKDLITLYRQRVIGRKDLITLYN